MATHYTAVAFALFFLPAVLWAADDKRDAPPILKVENVRSIAKLKSARVGTAFVILSEGRKAYMLTAAHVVVGRPGEKPECQIEFDTADRRAPCKVRYVWSTADLAVVYADLENIPGAVRPLELGDSALLASTGARVYTAGYPGGGKLQIDRGFVSGSEPPQLVLKGISAKDGQSGSPVFTESDGKVVGMILERPLDGQDLHASEIDSIKLFLRREKLFQYLMLFTRPPSGATGPLVPSDRGLSLTNIFVNPASPSRWFDRAKRYYRTDFDGPTIAPEDSWLGVRREYLSSSSNAMGSFGRGWTSQFEYRIDMERSDICNLHLWNPKNNRIILRPPHECAKVKDAIASHVESRDVLQGNLGEIMADKDLAENILPNNVSFTGADFDVLRARFVTGGVEVSVGSTKYIFNSRGKLRRVEIGSRSLELDYDAKGRLSVIRDGQYTQEFTYATSSLVSAVRFSDGTEFKYRYSSEERLIGVSSSSGRGYLYEYDRNGLLTKVKLRKGAAETETWIIGYTPEGRRSRVRHDDQEYRWRFVESANDMPSIEMEIWKNSEIQEKRSFQFDYQTKTLSMTIDDDTTVYMLTECLCLPLTVKKSDGEISYSYDPFGRLSEIKSGDVRMTYAYDDRFNKTSKVEHWSGNELIGEAQASYDSKGNLVRTKSGDGEVHTLTYDKAGRIESIRKGTAQPLNIVYNLIGKPVLVAAGGIGEIEVIYGHDGELRKTNSEGGPTVAMQIAAAFNSLLDSAAPFTAGASVDSRFSILTSEPGGCGECGRHQGD